MVGSTGNHPRERQLQYDDVLVEVVSDILVFERGSWKAEGRREEGRED